MPQTPSPLNAHSPLRWCFSSMGCAELSLPQIAKLATRHGAASVELRAVGGQIDIPTLAAQENWLAQPPATLLDNQPVEVVAFNASARLSKPFDECLSEIAGFAPLMAHFGARALRVFDGELDLHTAPEAAWHWLDAWEEARAANGWDFSLSIETHDSLFTAEEVEKLFCQGHPHIGLLWDSHHTWRKKGIDPLESWASLRPWTTHIHVKDSLPIPGEHLPYTYVEPGKGEFPLRALIDQLATDGFTGPVSLEWEKLWHPEMPPLEDALLALRKCIGRAV